MAGPGQKTPPLVGDFSGPKNNAPRGETLQRKEEEVEKKNEDDNDEETPPAKETKQERYLRELKERGISVEEARTILDNIFNVGAHTETIKIGQRVNVTLRTRMYADIQRAERYLETERLSYAMSIDDLMSRCNLAASLQEYGEKKFEFPSPTAENTKEVETQFQNRFNFILALPTFVVNRLMGALSEFDAKVMTVLADGAPEDF